LHGIPKKIVSDNDTQFTSHFWQQLHEALGTHLKFSSAYHPQTDGQTKRTNQILEDMLRACALQDKLGWDKRLLYVEFSYNNSYQASLKMSPFLSHPVLEGKPNANHVRARIRNSRTQ
jgi:transposase InsO family protein